MNWRAGQNPFRRFPAVTLLLALLACAPLFWRSQQLTVQPDARVLLEGDQRNLAAFEKVQTILNQHTVVVISMAGGNLFSQRCFDDLRELCNHLSTLPGLLDVKSLTHSVKPVRQGFSFEMVKFVPEGPLPEEEIQRIRQYCLAHPLVRNVMVSADGKHLLITATFQRALDSIGEKRRLREDVEAALKAFEPRGYRFQTIAMPFAEVEVYDTLKRDLMRVCAGALATSLLMLWLSFRSWRIIALILLNLAITQAGVAGLAQSLGISVTIYTAIAFPLLGGMHLALMAHLFTAFQQALPESAGVDAAMDEMLRRVFKSCAFATFISIIGELSLLLCAVNQVQRFGLIGALGIAWVFVWTFGPGLALHKLAWAGTLRRHIEPYRSSPHPPFGQGEGSMASDKPAPSPTNEAMAVTYRRRHTALPSHSQGGVPSGVSQPQFARLAEWVVARRRWILGLGVIALLFALLGAGFIRTDIRVSEFLDQSSPTRQALAEMNAVYGGVNIVQIELDTGRTNGVNDLTFLRWLDGVSRFALDQPGVSGAYSYAQLLAMMNQIWEQERAGSLRLPDSAFTVGLFAGALRARNYPFLTALVDAEGRRAFLVVRSQDMPSGQYLDVVERIVAHAEASRPAGVTVTAQEGLHSILEADRRILRAQAQTAVLTLGAIALVLAVLWRSVWLALLAVMVNVIPIGLVLGAAGLADVPLNSVTVMLAAIVLSIAVDDAVHFLTHWRDEMRTTGDASQAVANTLRVKGPPIVSTSLVLIGVFAPFALFSFPPLRHFGVLAAVAFAAATVSVLTLLPAAVAGIKPRRN